MTITEEQRQLLDKVVAVVLGDQEEGLRTARNHTAAKMVESGAQASEFAQNQMVRVHYKHFEAIASKVWSEMKRVAQEAQFGWSSDFEKDVLSYWQRAVADSYEKHRQIIYAILLPDGRLPKPAFRDAYEKIERSVGSEVSVFCAKMSAEKAERERNRMSSNVFVLTGNARVNLHSTDNSTNSTIIGEPELFSRLRDSLESGVKDRELLQEALALMEKMQESPKTSGFNTAYKDFISLLADHIQIVQAFVPALSQLIG